MKEIENRKHVPPGISELGTKTVYIVLGPKQWTATVVNAWEEGGSRIKTLLPKVLFIFHIGGRGQSYSISSTSVFYCQTRVSSFMMMRKNVFTLGF